MKTIGKTDLINDISSGSLFSKGTVESVIDQLVDTITSHAHAGHRVTLRGFGTFEVKTRKARAAKNPRTGELVQVPEKKVLTFKPSKPKT